MAECQFTVRFRQENPSVGSLADVLWAIDTVYYLFLALKFEPQARNSAVNALTLPFPRLEFLPDFSVVLFRPNFMLVSEENPVKTHKNQWLLNPLSPPDIPCGATNQGTHHGV